MSVGGGTVMVSGGLVDCGAVREMEVCWPSRAGLRRQALNHHKGLWLKTVVLNVVEKARQRSRQVWTGKMSDEREFSVEDVSKVPKMTSKPGTSPFSGMNLGDIRLLPRWCPAYRHCATWRCITSPTKSGRTGRRFVGPMSYLCLLYTSPSPRDRTRSRMPSSA